MSESSPLPTGKRSRSLKYLLVAGFFLAIAAGCYIYLFKYRSVGEGPAGPAVKRELFESVWTDRPVLLLGIGDSVTAGFGAEKGYSYFDRLVANPPDEFPEMRDICLNRVLPNLSTLNLSVSGSTSLQHAAKQLPRIPVSNSDTFGIVVMTTGGNDIIHDYGRRAPREGAMYGASHSQAKPWIASFEARLETMLDVVESRFPGGCAIFLANIYDPTDGVGDIEQTGLPAWPDGTSILADYNAAIARIAEKRDSVYLVDMRSAFLGHGIHCTQFWQNYYRSDDPHYWYYYNLEDPNHRGYDAIRRLFLNRIADVREVIQGNLHRRE